MTTATLQEPVHLTDQTFDDVVRDSGKPALVDFWADWCAPCHAIAPVLEEIATIYGERLTVAKVNVDENESKTTEFAIRALPTLILFRDGEPAQTLIGVQSQSDLKAAIDAHIDG